MNLVCSSCKKPLDPENAMTCPTCGNLHCSDCAGSMGNTCSHCYGDFRFYN